MKFDKQVLRFYGYWDDRESPYGEIHDLELHYYLTDDTIEIKEILPPNSGHESGPLFLKRSKVPKVKYVQYIIFTSFLICFSFSQVFINHCFY